MLHKVINRRFW